MGRFAVPRLAFFMRVQNRNIYNVKADWRFTAADARIKLKSLYPVGSRLD
jgi:hypothetical protein